MSSFDEGYKRLKIILVLFLFITGMYSIEFLCFKFYDNTHSEQPQYIIDVNTMEKVQVTEDYYKKLNDSNFTKVGKDYSFFDFMFFSLEFIPSWMGFIFSIVTLIVTIVTTYMLIEWVIAWYKALSPFS